MVFSDSTKKVYEEVTGYGFGRIPYELGQLWGVFRINRDVWFFEMANKVASALLCWQIAELPLKWLRKYVLIYILACYLVDWVLLYTLSKGGNVRLSVYDVIYFAAIQLFSFAMLLALTYYTRSFYIAYLLSGIYASSFTLMVTVAFSGAVILVAVRFYIAFMVLRMLLRATPFGGLSALLRVPMRLMDELEEFAYAKPLRSALPLGGRDMTYEAYHEYRAIEDYVKKRGLVNILLENQQAYRDPFTGKQ